MRKPKIFAVVGATASGKTSLAIALAKRLDGEIISCDSMQIYREMDVGTAKPTREERARVPHHLVDVADPCVPFSSVDYLNLAEKETQKILSAGKLPIFCGGTGLYLDGFLRGGFPEGGSDPAFREEMQKFAADFGNHALHERLASVDPKSADEIHENNVKRVVRALEIYHITGVPKSVADEKTKTEDCRYDATVVGIRFRDKTLLLDRIDRRAEQMMAEGLEEETKRLQALGVFEANATAAQAIGYKELFPYLRGEKSREEAVADLKLATRHYAKRQLTWFSAKPYVGWIDADRDGKMRTLDEMTADAIALFEEESK